MKGSSMKAFRRLCRVTVLRTLRDPVTVVFSLAFAPVFIIVMGLIFGNDPTPQFGGRGFLEANFTAFPGIVIAITSAIMVPVDMAAQRSAGVLRRFRATPLQPGYRGAKRIVYSDDGLVYYTDDHYATFTLLYGQESK